MGLFGLVKTYFAASHRKAGAGDTVGKGGGTVAALVMGKGQACRAPAKT